MQLYDLKNVFDGLHDYALLIVKASEGVISAAFVGANEQHGPILFVQTGLHEFGASSVIGVLLRATALQHSTFSTVLVKLVDLGVAQQRLLKLKDVLILLELMHNRGLFELGRRLHHQLARLLLRTEDRHRGLCLLLALLRRLRFVRRAA